MRQKDRKAKPALDRMRIAGFSASVRNSRRAESFLPWSYCSGHLRRWRLRAQGRPAIWTIDIIHANYPLTLWTTRAQLITAVGAEVKSALHPVPAVGADTAQRLPQKEVEYKAQPVGNKNGYQRPKYGAHPAASRVAVHVSDQ